MFVPLLDVERKHCPSHFHTHTDLATGILAVRLNSKLLITDVISGRIHNISQKHQKIKENFSIILPTSAGRQQYYKVICRHNMYLQSHLKIQPSHPFSIHPTPNLPVKFHQPNDRVLAGKENHQLNDSYGEWKGKPSSILVRRKQRARDFLTEVP